MAGPGAEKLQRLRDAGVAEAEVQAYKARATANLRGNATPQEIDLYWGDATPAPRSLDTQVQQNVEQNWLAGAKVASNPIEMLAAGWDMSATSLLQHAPKTIAPQHAGLVDRVFQVLGQGAGDLPFTITGLIGGTAAGASVGAGGGAVAGAPTGPGEAVTIPAGAVVGGVAGGGFGSAALPTAVRETMIDHYKNGDLSSVNDLLTRSAHVAWETGKQGIVGAISAPLGGVVGRKVLGVGLTATADEVATVAAQQGLLRRGAAGVAEATTYATTATAVGAGLEGRAPDAQDFYSAAVLAVGLHAAGGVVGAGKRFVPNARGERVADNMRTIYAETGIPPWEQAQRAKSDPALAQELYARNASDETIKGGFYRDRLDDPPPYDEQKSTWTPEKETAFQAARGRNPDGTPKVAPEAGSDPITFGLKAVDHLENSEGAAAAARKRGVKDATPDNIVSPAGAIGRYQVMPNTARALMGKNFDTRTLLDPKVNEEVAGKLMHELTMRYKRGDTVDWEAVYIAYNGGPKRADRFLANGRDVSKLPVETQRYLARADAAGLTGSEIRPPTEPVEVPTKDGEPDYAAMSDAEAEAAVHAIIQTPDKPSLLSSGGDLADTVYRRYVSLYGPAKKLDVYLGIDKDAVGFEDLFRSTAASPDRAGEFITSGAFDPHTFERVSNESYMDAYKLAKKNGGTEQGFVDYRLAKRTLEKAGQGVETGIDPKLAERVVEAGRGRYEEADQMVNRAKNDVLDYYHKSGMLSSAGLEALKANNQSHIPFRRVMEGDVPAVRVGRGFQARQSIKKMEGSKRQIVEPVMAEIESIHRLIANADRNIALQALVGLDPVLLEHLGIRKAAEQPEDINAKLLAGKGDNGGPAWTPEELGLAHEKASGPPSDKDFTVFIDGKPVTYQIDSPGMAEMIRGHVPLQSGPVGRAMTWVAQVKRSGITSMPAYLLRMTVRDQIEASVFARFGGFPMQNLLYGVVHVLGQTEQWHKFVRSGGMGAALADMDKNYLRTDVERIFRESGTWGAVLNAVQDLPTASRLVMERVDAMSRLGAMARAEKAGLSPLKAAMVARKLNLDFTERGTSQRLQALAQQTVFLRANILANDRMIEAVKQRPVETALRATAFIAAPSILLWLYWHEHDKHAPEDEKFSNRARWLRDTHWLLPPVGDVVVKVPKPQGSGLLFGSLIERFLDHMATHDPRAFKEFKEDFMGQFFPNVTPDWSLPILEQMVNKSMFNLKPLVPQSSEKASGYMQYTDATSETAKNLTKLLGAPMPHGLGLPVVSPIVVDNYVRQWTGGVGTMVFKILDVPQKAWNHKVEPPSQLADNPIIGSLFVRNESMSTVPITDFYDGLDKLTQKHEDLALAIKRGDPNELNWASSDIRAFVDLQQIAETLSDHRQAIEAIKVDPTMTVDEKRQQTEELFTNMLLVAKSGLEALDEVDQAQDAPVTNPPIPAPVAPGSEQAPAAPPAPEDNRGMVPVS